MAILERDDSPPIGLVNITEVRIGVAPERLADVRAFYEDLLRLEPWPPADQFPGAWGLGPRRRGLLLLLAHDPAVDRVARRFSILVPDLAALEKRLADAGVAYERVTSLGPGEDVVSAHDPQGHRVEFRQSRRL